MKPVTVQVKTANLKAMQFTTNNELDGSPHMDGIVNWLNQGKSAMVAWHNGTSIFIKCDCFTPGEQTAVDVGDWVIRDEESHEVRVISNDMFRSDYHIVVRPAQSVAAMCPADRVVCHLFEHGTHRLRASKFDSYGTAQEFKVFDGNGNPYGPNLTLTKGERDSLSADGFMKGYGSQLTLDGKDYAKKILGI